MQRVSNGVCPHHLQINIEQSDSYTLPPKVKITRNLAEPIFDHLKNKDLNTAVNFLTTQGKSLTTHNALTHLDNQTTTEEGFFNIQLQLKKAKKSKKTTLAKVLIPEHFKNTTCPHCQKTLIDTFFEALQTSFQDSVDAYQAKKTTSLQGRIYKLN